METVLADYFEKCSVLAKRLPDLCSQDYEIAGYPVRLYFSGDSLQPFIGPAIAHLRIFASTAAPKLNVYLWDEKNTGMKMPAPPWQNEDIVQRGEIIGFTNSERFKVTFVPGADALSMVDMVAGEAIYRVPCAVQIPYYDWSAPLRNILHFWMSAHGRFMLHAAAVGNACGGFLLAGKGGSGKSTTALTCLGSTLGYLGDDHLLVGWEPQPTAHSLYNSAKLQPDHLRRFPRLLPAVQNPERLDREKALAFLFPDHKDCIVKEFPIRALLIPRVTGETQTRFRHISRMATLLALAPSTILQLPSTGAAALESLRRLTEDVPGYLLELGTDIDNIPVVLQKKLNELASGKEERS